MAQGGARSRSGPAPDPQAARRDRRDDVSGWTILPNAGRLGPLPTWPFPTSTRRELDVWEKYWRKPQAVIWERDHLVEVVALFVRQFVEAEAPTSSAENRKTVRLMAADLYLSSDSLARARYKIAEPEAPSAGRAFRKTGTTSHLAVVVGPETDV